MLHNRHVGYPELAGEIGHIYSRANLWLARVEPYILVEGAWGICKPCLQQIIPIPLCGKSLEFLARWQAYSLLPFTFRFVLPWPFGLPLA